MIFWAKEETNSILFHKSKDTLSQMLSLVLPITKDKDKINKAE